MKPGSFRLVERIGIKDSVVEYAPAGRKKSRNQVDIADHQTAIRRVLEKLVIRKIGVIKSLSDIAAIGHRVVHGAEKFSGSVLVNEAVTSRAQGKYSAGTAAQSAEHHRY